MLQLACGASDTGPSAAGSVVAIVERPALTGVDADARRQIESVYDALLTRQENPETSTADLGAAHGELGRILLAAELDEAAQRCFATAVALVPAEPRWTYYLAHAHRRRANLPAAIEYFERTLELQPDNGAALWWLGTMYLDAGRTAEAETRFSRMMGLQPRALSAVYGLGRAALARGDYASAVDHFERVLAMNARATAAHYPLGLAYRGLGRIREAEIHLAERSHMEILPIDPWMTEIDQLLQSVTAHQDRGLRAELSGDWEAAAGHFRRATELAPDNLDARLALAAALNQLGNVADAREHARHVLRVSPGNARARALLGAATP